MPQKPTSCFTINLSPIFLTVRHKGGPRLDPDCQTPLSQAVLLVLAVPGTTAIAVCAPPILDQPTNSFSILFIIVSIVSCSSAGTFNSTAADPAQDLGWCFPGLPARVHHCLDVPGFRNSQPSIHWPCIPCSQSLGVASSGSAR